MKKIIIVFAISFVTFCVTGQTPFTYATTIGTGIAMDEPSATPFTWQVLGYYNISQRFSAGVGTGFSYYEMTLIPVFAGAKLTITQPRRFTPFVECAGGYAFAPNKNTNGGTYFNPSIGLQYALPNKMKLQLAIGYELQNAERLKESINEYFTVGFAEKLSYQTVSVKVGILF